MNGSRWRGWQTLRRFSAPALPAPNVVALSDTRLATQAGFGKIMDDIARKGGPLADRIVTKSPDVTVSTNLGGWVNRRGLFARESRADTFRDEPVPDAGRIGPVTFAVRRKADPDWH